MKSYLIIILCFISFNYYSQLMNLTTLDINLNIPPPKHKVDYTENVLMVVGGLGFITAGVLGNNKNRRDPFNNQNALFWRVSPSKLAIVLGSGTVVLGLTIRL